MAAAPVKSPLHNFPLTFLKWGSKKDQQRCRRPQFDSPLSPQRPPSSDPEPSSNSKHVGSRSSRNRRNNNHPPPPPPPPPTTTDDEVADIEEGDVEKGWNLRPRRTVSTSTATAATTTTTTTTTMVETTRLRGIETVNNGNGNGSERREKRRFWIALSRDEIEEDIYSMTGHKPSRRPRKRPKLVQKQVDNVFPGLWLVGVAPDAYRGLDIPPPKR